MRRAKTVLIRLFSPSYARGTRNYLNSQKKYEIIRTCIFFAVSVSLFAAGYLQTGERANLLSIVAILGCLPASKSAVSAIMFLRYKSCNPETADKIAKHSGDLDCLYDMVFTSEKVNYCVSHLAVRGNTVCGYVETPSSDTKVQYDESKRPVRKSRQFDENGFYKHITSLLEMDGHRDVTVKVFKSLPKYTERLDQMNALAPEPENSQSIITTLKSVAL